jgi:hypothetical protein
VSIRFELPEDSQNRIKEIIDKRHKDIIVNSRLTGIRTVPDWAENLTKDKISQGDNSISVKDNLIDFMNLGISQKMVYSIQKIFPSKLVHSSGYFHYPPTGFMGWHTNSDYPCQRLYITYTKEANKSFFRYMKGEEMITDYDDAGITTRLFDIKKDELFWHCVGSETDRISFGFSIV